MNVGQDGVRASLLTPIIGSGAAIAIVQLSAPISDALDRDLARADLAPLEVGQVLLRTLPGGDRGLCVRWSPTCAQLFPHGGKLVIDALRDALRALGVEMDDGASRWPLEVYPEARDLIEACALEAIARATSPRAIDAILEASERWRRPSSRDAPSEAHDRVLGRLIDPPLVVIAGPPNAGKSTLVNALARRRVSITSPAPGTTRDHVGVMLEVDGLAIRCLDLPGWRDPAHDPIETRAIELSQEVVASADLVVHCASSDVPGSAAHAPPTIKGLRVGTKADLATPPAESDLVVSAVTGLGMDELAHRIRRALVPDAALAATRRWRFHPGLPMQGDGDDG